LNFPISIRTYARIQTESNHSCTHRFKRSEPLKHSLIKTALDSLNHEQRVERTLENFDIHQLSPTVLLTTYTVMKTDPHTKLNNTLGVAQSGVVCQMYGNFVSIKAPLSPT